MEETHDDELGFRIFCNEAQLQWITVKYVHSLASSNALLPRKQEVPDGSFVIGCPDSKHKKFVLSHGWDSSNHISPNGEKLRDLSAALKKQSASGSDVVFIECVAATQMIAHLPCRACHRAVLLPTLSGSCLCDSGRASVCSYAGLPQKLPAIGLPDMYYVMTGRKHGSLEDRTPADMQRFTFALFEMNRLYSYKECYVIVLPQVHSRWLIEPQSSPSR